MQRVIIGRNFAQQPAWKRYLGVPLVYLPLVFTIPFMLVGVILIRSHLHFVGGMNIRSYWSFTPTWLSHRYRNAEQPIFHTDTTRWQFRAYRWFWVFNCKLYCPLSVALFSYSVYLVKIVENWWCPFGHDKKSDYSEGAIDQSYWHIFPAEYAALHPEDRDNIIWNDLASKPFK